MPSRGQPQECLLFALGGTITSKKYLKPEERSSYIRPEKENAVELRDRVLEKIKHLPMLENIRLRRPEFPMDSSDYNSHVLATLVNIIREKMYQIYEEGDPKRRSSVIVWTGTDQAADLCNALVNGIPKSLMNRYHSLLVTCSQHHLEVPGTDAVPNAAAAFLLSQFKELRGKIALVMGGKIFPARGLEKIHRNGPQLFDGRYPQIGSWVFTNHKHQIMPEFSEKEGDMGVAPAFHSNRGLDTSFDRPAGNPKERFQLAQGIEEKKLASTSDYGNLRHDVLNADEKFRGAVLVFPGDSNARTAKPERYLLELAAQERNGIPLVAVGTGISHWQYEDHTGQADHYEGLAHNIPGIISGGNMTSTEARIYLAQQVAEIPAEIQADRRMTVRYVRAAFARYPFL